MSQLPDFWRGAWPRDLDQLFEGFGVPTLRRGDPALGASGFSPRCEVAEDDKAYTVRFEIPGLSKEQIKIDLHENRLSVSGEKKEEKKENSQHRHFSEVSYGAFSRSMTFPSTVDPEKVAASYDHGVLKIEIPKSAASRSKQITIR